MQQRSTFVTVIGWIFILLSAIGALQSLLLIILPLDEIMALAGHPAVNPAVHQPVDHTVMHRTFIFLFVVQTWVLLSSIGLVMRNDWARISFIIICSIGTFFSAIFVLLGILDSGPTRDTVLIRLDIILRMVLSILGVVGAVSAVVFIFTIYKLNTQKVIQEFLPQPRS